MGVSGGFVGRFNLQFQGERISVQHSRARPSQCSLYFVHCAATRSLNSLLYRRNDASISESYHKSCVPFIDRTCVNHVYFVRKTSCELGEGGDGERSKVRISR